MAVSVLGLFKVARCTARIHSYVLATMALGVQVGLQWKLRSFDLKSLAIIHYRIEVPIRADCAPRSNGFSPVYCASCAKRNPRAPERSMLGETISNLPCSVSLYACGKYQIEPCGW